LNYYFLSKQITNSWSKFGREAEFVVALFLRLRGWDIELSKGSRGPADIIATYKNHTKWLIQVKSSTGLAHLKGNEVKRLREASQINGGLAVIAILQPTEIVLSSSIIDQTNNNESMTITKWNDNCRNDVINLGNYAIVFYSLNNWKRIIPNSVSVLTPTT
jgi:Holliday junction resolvase